MVNFGDTIESCGTLTGCTGDACNTATTESTTCPPEGSVLCPYTCDAANGICLPDCYSVSKAPYYRPDDECEQQSEELDCQGSGDKCCVCVEFYSSAPDKCRNLGARNNDWTSAVCSSTSPVGTWTALDNPESCDPLCPAEEVCYVTPV